MRPDVLQTIDEAIAQFDPELRKLSLDIWSECCDQVAHGKQLLHVADIALQTGHPEIRFEEKYDTRMF